MSDHADNADKLISQTVDSRTAVVRAKLKKERDNPPYCECCGDAIPLARQQLPFKVVTCISCAQDSELKDQVRRV